MRQRPAALLSEQGTAHGAAEKAPRGPAHPGHRHAPGTTLSDAVCTLSVRPQRPLAMGCGQCPEATDEHSEPGRVKAGSLTLGCTLVRLRRGATTVTVNPTRPHPESASCAP